MSGGVLLIALGAIGMTLAGLYALTGFFYLRGYRDGRDDGCLNRCKRLP